MSTRHLSVRDRSVLRRAVAVVLLGFLPGWLPGVSSSWAQHTTASVTLDRSGTLWSPYLEWSVPNSSYSGNPFDVLATVTFTHSSGATHTTEMFYDGEATWKWRFTGTKVGTWTFSTSSSDAELDGLSGTVTIDPNPEEGSYGFVGKAGNKWVRDRGNSGAREPFIPQFRNAFEKSNSFDWSSAEIDALLDRWMGQEGFNGVLVFMAGYWVDVNAVGARFRNRDPDLKSFRILEEIITKVHARGGVVHIWYNGDCQRSQCVEAGFGAAGATKAGEQRLLRYIAARLGPLPGWIMGYGYDLQEFASPGELDGWADYLRARWGWSHLLGARDGTTEEVHYTFWSGADWHSRGGWFSGVGYETSVAAMDSDASHPHAFDERWWESRMSEAEQRRQLWTLAMAGGISAIWGAEGDYEKEPYDNPWWFKTYFRFWEGRLLQGMERCNELTDGYCLGDAGASSYVFYKEETDRIEVDLSGAGATLSAVAVDVKSSYAEQGPCVVTAEAHTWELPYTSDWAIAIGDFGGREASAPTGDHAICNILEREVTGTGTESFSGKAPDIGGAYPNPFRERTVVRVSVPQAQAVRAVLYDATGRQVRVLWNGFMPAHAVQEIGFEARGLSGGMYFVHIQGERFQATEPVLLVR
ncbi:hypothetical protein AWN76_015570 [Rhodothermaceae bacterium RA]|nr:hypothetical protein AWN76_015570 [Rhodothermaceae bacterium RA]